MLLNFILKILSESYPSEALAGNNEWPLYICRADARHWAQLVSFGLRLGWKCLTTLPGRHSNISHRESRISSI